MIDSIHESPLSIKYSFMYSSNIIRTNSFEFNFQVTPKKWDVTNVRNPKTIMTVRTAEILSILMHAKGNTVNPSLIKKFKTGSLERYIKAGGWGVAPMKKTNVRDITYLIARFVNKIIVIMINSQVKHINEIVLIWDGNYCFIGFCGNKLYYNVNICLFH